MGLFPNELEHLTQRAMAEKVMGWLKAHPELKVSGDNRLTRQCRLVVESRGIIHETDPNWPIFVQSLKDVQEYWFMIEILGDRLMGSPFLDRFAQSLWDPTHPLDSGASTPGRDAQFESFLAAIATRAELKVDKPGNAGADWVLTSPTGHWSLEAKRIKSLKKMETHFRKAASQIVKSEIGGVIAMDISLACNSNCKPLPGSITDTQIDKAHEERMNVFVDKYQTSIEKWMGPANVGFVLLHDFVIRTANVTEMGHESAGLFELWRKVDLIAADSSNRHHYDELWSFVNVALPNL
jgi:hypothetical protein